ncbi:MAG: hypothetical protein ABI425_03375 [Patescibacteria group bacterium]
MKKALYSIFFLFILSVVSSAFFVPQTFAEISGGNVNDNFRQTMENTRDNKTNLDHTIVYSLEKNAYGLLYLFNGDPNGNGTGLTDTGAMGAVGKMIGFAYTQPASEKAYFADLFGHLGAQPAYAQGIGFSALQPVLALWKIFRDISYVFFVFIFLAIGFGIMFRQNLGGQTAVTIQQALPRIIIALLAVSFSYAIAGLMIDIMWIMMYFLITMFGGAGLIQSDLLANFKILNLNIFDVFGGVIGSGFANKSGEAVGSFVNNVISNDQGINNALGSVAGGITSVLATLIIFVAVLFAMFRTFFSLIKVYFEIILSIIFAPVILMLGAINGNAFGNWVKALAVNLAVFPVLLVFIIIGFMMINGGSAVQSSAIVPSVNAQTNGSLPQQLQGGGFIPPFVPGRNESDTIGFIGGIAAIMLLPEVVAIVSKYKPASIFEEFGGKAVSNVFQGNQYAAPLVGLGAGGAAGAAVGGYMGYRTAQNPTQAFAQTLRGVVYGHKDAAGKTRGGFVNWGGAGYKAGQSTASAIDRAREGKLLDPDTINRQLDDIRKGQNKPTEPKNDKPEKTGGASGGQAN